MCLLQLSPRWQKEKMKIYQQSSFLVEREFTIFFSLSLSKAQRFVIFVAYASLLDLSLLCIVAFIISMLSRENKICLYRVLTLVRMSPMKTSAWLYKMQLVLGVLCLYLRYDALVPFCVRATVLISSFLRVGQLS